MSFAIYLVGYVIFTIGLLIAAHLLHVPPRWIGVAAIVLVGAGVMGAVTHTRRRDPS
jgi:hypothetical protein